LVKIWLVIITAILCLGAAVFVITKLNERRTAEVALAEKKREALIATVADTARIAYESWLISVNDEYTTRMNSGHSTREWSAAASASDQERKQIEAAYFKVYKTRDLDALRAFTCLANTETFRIENSLKKSR
jgi:hypothetical protein